MVENIGNYTQGEEVISLQSALDNFDKDVEKRFDKDLAKSEMEGEINFSFRHAKTPQLRS